MKLETINGIRVITPSEDAWLCNESDKVISDRVYLGVYADETKWCDITEAQKASLEILWNEANTTESEATEFEEAGVFFDG